MISCDRIDCINDLTVCNLFSLPLCVSLSLSLSLSRPSDSSDSVRSHFSIHIPACYFLNKRVIATHSTSYARRINIGVENYISAANKVNRGYAAAYFCVIASKTVYAGSGFARS